MLNLHPIPAFSDNYIWCLHDDQQAFVVDPGEAPPVEQYLQQNQLTLAGILITHHHWDHVSGIEALVSHRKEIPVYGPSQETIPCITHPLSAGDSVTLSPWDLKLEVMEVPGHTLGHIAFQTPQSDLGPLLFCGDTLFSSGCGRLFEGTPHQMWQSLQQFTRLSDTTLVCCTHEYTMANLKFALAVEPENKALQQRLNEVSNLRKLNKPSLPSTIGLEKQVNPFLRVNDPHVIDALAHNCGKRPQDDAESFAKLRAWKDSF